jgi:hypothetical protein
VSDGTILVPDKNTSAEPNLIKVETNFMDGGCIICDQ